MDWEALVSFIGFLILFAVITGLFRLIEWITG